MEHRINHGGAVIFGWCIWQRDSNHFVAQHHAIWKSEKGKYHDLTRNPYSNEVLFIPDGKALFDYNSLRCPFNFEKKNNGEEQWFASDRSSNEFSIMQLIPFENERDRIDSIIKKAKNLGFI